MTGRSRRRSRSEQEDLDPQPQRERGGRRAPLIEELEPRILFSADLPGLPVEALLPGPGTETEAVHAEPLATPSDASAEASTEAAEHLRRELVFVDARVADHQSLVDELLASGDASRRIEVVVLDAEGDGIARIGEVLAGYAEAELDAVHVVSHGTEQGVQIGGSWLSTATLGPRADAVAAWGTALAADGDLLFYGCNLAGGAEGRALVDALGELTGADVAASVDLTGSALLGGDWDLEYRVGEVEAAAAFDAQSPWTGLLADVVHTSYESSNNEAEVKSDANWGQTFSHTSGGGTYTVDHLSVQLRRGFSAPTQEITVSLRESWNGPDLGSASISSDDLDTAKGWHSFYVGELALNDGQTYYLRVTSDTTAGLVYLAFDDTGSYANGDRIDDAGSAISAEDIAFRVEDRAPLVGDGAAFWSQTGLPTPEASPFDGASFGPTVTTASVGGPWLIMDGAEAPTRDEKILVGIDAGSNMSGQMWDGVGWSALPFSLGTANHVHQAFDVSYESQSGDALLVYTNGTAGTGGLSYRVWNGTSWSGETTITTPNPGEALSVRLASSPQSDEIVLVWTNQFNADYALVWNGSGWTDPIWLDDGFGVATHTEIEVAYEQQSGDAMVVVGRNSKNARYAVWNGSSWSGPDTLSAPAGVGGHVQWTDLASDPNSDRLVLGVTNTSGDTWLAVWDGDSWEPSEIATGWATGTGYRNVAVGFESLTGEALATYGNAFDNKVHYQIWDGSWSGDLDGPDLGTRPTSMTLSADPLTNQLVLATQDLSSDVSFVRWDGREWGVRNELETDTGQTAYQPFLFLFDHETTTPPEAGLWLATVADVDAPGAPGLVSWSESEVIEFGDPDLVFEPVTGTTDGTFFPRFDLDAFGFDTDVDAVHYVARDLEIGASGFALYEGDLLLSTAADETLTGLNMLDVAKEDVFVFRPGASGDYGSGWFYMLLDDPLGRDIQALALVEDETQLGDTTLELGDFLLATGPDDKYIALFETIDVGVGSSGTSRTLLDGDDLDVGISKDIFGLDLLEVDATIGGVTLDAGTLLLSVSGGTSTGSNSEAVDNFDVFALDVTQTTPIAGLGNGAATATLLLDGSDVGIDQSLAGVTTLVSSTDPPTLTLPGPSVTYTENDPATVLETGAILDDPGGAGFGNGKLTVDFALNGAAGDRLEIRDQGPGVGNISLAGSDVLYDFGTGPTVIGSYAGGTSGSDPLVVNLNPSADLASVTALVQNVTYRNVSDDPSVASRRVRFEVVDANEATSSPALETVDLVRVNDAPVLGNNSLTISEGQTVVLGSGDLSATDVDDGNGGLTLTVSGVSGGQFELVAAPGSPITSFTRGQVNTGQVQFVHDGGEAAPSYSVTVDDGSLSDGPAAATISFTNQNDPPVLANNSLTIARGQTVVLRSSDLLASDPDHGPASLTYTVSGVSGGQFELVAPPGSPITTFSQDDVDTGKVRFVHDGGVIAPAYSVTVDDGSLSDGPHPASISFTKPLVGDGAAFWSEDGLRTPEASAFDGATFGPTGTTAHVGGPWLIMDGAEAPSRDEKILVGINAANEMAGQIWDGVGWSALPFNDFGSATELNHAFDVAYESQSSDALLVYANGSSGANSISYRVWNGASWSAESSIAIPGRTVNLHLASSPDSDEIVLVATNDLEADYALVWNGSSWHSPILLDDGVGVSIDTEISVAYEQQSGDAMVVFGGDSRSAYYSVWNGSSWSGPAALTAPAAAGGYVRWTDLASDPNSDRLVLGVVSDAAETWLAVWDGDSWLPAEMATASASGTGYRNVAVGFESLTGEAIATYGTSLDNKVHYRTWDGSWSGDLEGPDLGHRPTSLTLSADPLTNQLVLGTLDDSSDVSFVRWDGREWGLRNELETETGQTAYQPFLFLFDHEVTTPPEAALWLTTDADVDAPGAPGLVSWSESEVIEFGDPDLVFEPVGGTTDGTFFPKFDLDAFGADTDVDAVHYVARDLAIGASGFALYEGDLLLSTAADETLTSLNMLDVAKEDVFVFRPDTPGDYSSGWFSMLLDNPLGQDIRAVALVEDETQLGDTTLELGDFLLVAASGPFEKQITLYETLDVGVGSSGSFRTLLDGPDLGVGISKNIFGLDLLEVDATIGGVTLDAGTLLLNVNGGASVGSNSEAVDSFDVFALDVTQTTPVAGLGNGTATATLLLDGSDVGIDKALAGVTTLVTSNPPTLALPGPSLTYTENDPATILDAGAVVGDPEGAGFGGGKLSVEFALNGTAGDRLEIRDQGPGVGNISLVGSDVFYDFGTGPTVIGSYAGGTSDSDPLVVSLNPSADPTSVTALVRNVSYRNVSDDPSVASRRVRFQVVDANEATSSPALKTVDLVAVNDAPTLANNGLTISEGGTVVLGAGDLSATDVDDPDASLTFTVSGVSGGQFELVAAPGSPITTFSQDDVATGKVQFVHDGGEAAPSYSVAVDDGSLGSGPQAATIDYTNLESALWLTTRGPVSGGGQPGLDTWDSGDVVALTNPILGPGVTNGTFAGAFNVDLFAAGAETNAVHFVNADIDVGATSFPLQQGDLLLSLKVGAASTVTLTGNAGSLDPGFTNSLVVDREHVFVFRPESAGDYSKGSFAMLLDDPTFGGHDIRGITLVENDTVVGETLLEAGDFLFTRSGASDHSSVWWFDTTSVGAGAATAGSPIRLIEGTDAGIGITDQLWGIELVETQTLIGGQKLSEGTILLTHKQSINVGTNNQPVTEFDVFALAVSKTTHGSGPGMAEATASVVFQGSNVSFDDLVNEPIDGITFAASVSSPSIVANSLAISEGATVVLGSGDLSASDPDTAATTLAYTVSGLSGGQFELVAAPGSPITTFTQDDVDTGKVQFVHDGGEAAPSYSVTVSDGSLADGPSAAVVAFANLNDAPALANNSLTINEGQTVVLGSGDLSATDVDDSDASLTFTVSGVSGGQFELVAAPGSPITSFSQDDVATGKVQFVHDGGEAAPSYSVTVSDGSLADGPSAAVVAFANLNDAPALANNSLTINEGQTVVLGSGDLSATDVDDSDASLTFTVSGVSSGQFELVAAPGSPITTFTQDDVATGKVRFVHDGGEAAPAYSVTVDDGSLSGGPAAATITFANLNDAPVLANNSLTIDEGGTVVLGAGDLSATDVDDSDASLNFTVSSVTGGQFERVSVPTVAITSFLQSEVGAGDIVFVHDGGEAAPSYDITVADSSLSDGPAAAVIAFANLNDAPVLANNGLTIAEGGTVVLGAGDLSATDVDHADASLSFTVSGVSGGQFELVAAPGSPITTFTQDDVATGKVRFVHDGGEAAPAYSVTVSDGSLAGGPAAAAVAFSNVNDAPSLGNGSLTPVVEDTASPPGATITSLFGSSFSDVDGSFAGVAVVANAAPAGEGVWEYSSDGVSWFAIGSVNDGGSALAIEAPSRLRFVPAPDYNGTPTDLVLRGLDDSYTGAWSTTASGETRVTVDTTSPGGSTPIAAATSTLATSVSADNDAPVLGSNGLTIAEGGTVVLGIGDLSASDVDDADASLGFTVSGVNGGQFERVSVPGVPITSFLQSEVGAGDIRFVHDGGEAAPAYSVSVSDGSLADGPAAAVVAFSNVNDAPSLGNGSLAPVVEDTASPPGATIASLFGGTFSDPDGSFAGVAVVANAAPAAEGVWEYSSDGISWFAVGTVNDGASALAIEAPSRLRFVPASDYNGTPTDLVVRGLDDSYPGAWSTTASGETRVTVDTASRGGSTPVAAASSTLATSVSADNDAPVLANNSLTIAEGGTVVLGIGDLSASDVDDADAGLTFTVSGVSGGQFELVAAPGSPITSFSQDDVATGKVQFVHDGGEAAPAYSVSVSDGSLGDGPHAASISFSNVNEAPSLGSNALTIAEGGSVVLAAADLSATDVDDADPSLVFSVSNVTNGWFERVSAPGAPITSFSQAEVTTGDIRFVHDGDEAAPSYDVTVSDAGLSDGPAAAVISFSNANDAPTVTALPGDVLGYPEGAGPLVIDQGADALVTDPDSANFGGGSLRVSIGAGATPLEEILSIRDEGTGAGQIGFSGGVVSYEGTPIGTASGGTGGADLVVSLDPTATPTAVSALLRNVTYENIDAVTATVGSRTVDFQLDDGDGDTTAVAATVTVFDTNSAPTISGTATGQTVDDDATVTPFFGVSIDDVDVPVQALTVDVSLDDAAKGTLSGAGFSHLGGGVYRFTGSAAAATTGIQGLIFDPTENRVAPGDVETTTFTITVNDGISAPVSDPNTTVISTSINDAPSLGNASLAPVVEDTTSPPGATITSLFGGSFGDVDGSFAGVAVVANAAPAGEGVWEYSSDGISWFAVGSVNDGGSALAIEAPSRLRFVPAPDYNGTPTDLVVRGLDDSYTGAWSTTASGETRVTVDTTSPGGSTPIAAASSTLATSVSADNDAPVLGSNGLTIAEGGTVVLGAGDLSATDVDDADASLSFTVSGVSGGQFELVAAPGSPITTFTQDDVATGKVRFVHDGGEAAPAYSVTVSDGSLADGPAAAAVAFSNVNDAPSLGNGSLAPVVEDTASPPGATITSLFGGSFSDVDGSFAGVAVVANAAPAGEGVWEYSSDGISWFAVGTVNDGGSALAIEAPSRLRFVPAPDYNGTPTDLVVRGLDDSYSGAWSTTASGETRVTVDTTSPGGSTPIAAATSTLATSVSADDDAPVLGSNGLTIAEGGTVVLGAGDLAATDVDDADASLTFTVSGVSGGQFERVSVPGVPITSFLQSEVGAGDIRFVHGGGEAAPAYSVSVSDGSLADGPAAAAVAFSNVNDAPTLGNGTLTAVVEDTVSPPGATIASLFGGTFSDPDGSFAGVAVVANAAPAAEGVWEYSSDGVSWFAVGTVNDGASALAIEAPSRLRFVPAPDYNGTPTDLVLRGLDDSYPGAWSTTASGETRVTVDTASRGGSTPIAAASSTLATSVTPDNDAPVLANNSLTIAEGGTVVLGIGDLSASDVDDADAGLTFTVSGVSGGQFELVAAPGSPITSFSQDDVATGKVQFVHDGGEAAPAYSVTVSDGSLGDGPHAASISFSNVNDAPTIAGTTLGQTLNDKATIDPFSTVTLADADPGASLVVDVWLDLAAKGTLTNLGGFISLPGGLYRFSGSAADATTAIRGLVFDPTENRVTPGDTETTTFTIIVDDGVAAPVVNGVTTAVTTSVNDAPTIAGTVGGQAVDDTATIDPFTGVTFADADNPSQTLTVEVELDDPAKGSLVNLGGFAPQGGGVYRFVGNASSATAAIRGLTFDPTQNRVAVGLGETTTFTIRVDDGTPVVSDTTTTVISTSVNDAPTLSPGFPNLNPITEDEVANGGQQVLTLLAAATIGDLDPGALQGIAVTALASGNGTWQYDTGSGWANVGGVSDGSALLLRPTDTVRFVPDGRNADLASFSYRAWDQTKGIAGSKVNLSAATADSAFSSAKDTASITVTAENDAPALGNATLAPLKGSKVDPPGEVIKTLFAGLWKDVDAGASLTGLAVVGNDANALKQGSWQYSSDGGASWFAIGAVDDAGSALAVDAASLVRFVPVKGFVGSPSALVVRGLDDTYTGSFSSTGGGTEGRVTLDTSSPGGTSAIASSPSRISTLIGALPAPPSLPPSEPPPDTGGDDGEDVETDTGADTEGTPPADTTPPPGSDPGGSLAPTGSAGTPPGSRGLEREARELEQQRIDRVHTTAVEAVKALIQAGAPGIPAGIELADLIFEDQRADFLGELDRVQEDLGNPMQIEARVVGSAMAVTSGLSVGYVVWMTRGGLLLASLLSSMPAWGMFDPLPILAGLRDDEDEDQESLESILEQEPPPGEPDDPEAADSQAAG